MAERPVGVLGAGSWGTALAVYCATLGRPVRLWGRDAESSEAVERSRRSDRYLPGIELPDAVRVGSDLSQMIGCDPVLVVVPSHVFRVVVRDYLDATPAREERTLISASKGIEVEGHTRMSEVIEQEARRARRSVAVASLSGPTFAEELARGIPSAAVIAAREESLAESLCEEFSSGRFRLYSSTDLTGVELGGTTKNVIAIGAGMLRGLGLGHNTRAALITRGLREITRLGVASGGLPETFAGLAGLGDLVLTCTGGASRNLQAGVAIAAGKTLEQIQGEAAMVAEGLINTRSVALLARDLGVEMPITEQMDAVIYGGQEPARALEELMTRDLRAEVE